ncbi:MAG TPA: hypothetical protein VGJ66_06605 [Pyrinomonadaceae bacterium]|jgi:hypothetical protein
MKDHADIKTTRSDDGGVFMDINRLTEKAQEALRAAQSEATRLGHE